jgi:hypothetical protein
MGEFNNLRKYLAQQRQNAKKSARECMKIVERERLITTLTEIGLIAAFLVVIGTALWFAF